MRHACVGHELAVFELRDACGLLLVLLGELLRLGLAGLFGFVVELGLAAQLGDVAMLGPFPRQTAFHELVHLVLGERALRLVLGGFSRLFGGVLGVSARLAFGDDRADVLHP